MKSKIGQLADTEDILGTRDAVHVPVVIVTSEELLLPGEWVKFADSTYTRVISCEYEDRHGIVDPFVSSVPKHTRFLMMVIPEGTTKVEHNFNFTFKNMPTKQYKDPDDECRGCY